MEAVSRSSWSSEEGNPPIHPSYGPEPGASAMAPALRACPLKDSFSEFGEKEVRMDMEINTCIAMRLDHLFFPELDYKAIVAPEVA